MKTGEAMERATLLNRDELGAWRGLLRVHAGMTKTLDAELMREHRLPLSSYEVLLYLADSPGGRLRMSELADSVLLIRSGLTSDEQRALAAIWEKVRPGAAGS